MLLVKYSIFQMSPFHFLQCSSSRPLLTRCFKLYRGHRDLWRVFVVEYFGESDAILNICLSSLIKWPWGNADKKKLRSKFLWHSPFQLAFPNFRLNRT
jgi:hypothetical protein